MNTIGHARQVVQTFGGIQSAIIIPKAMLIVALMVTTAVFNDRDQKGTASIEAGAK